MVSSKNEKIEISERKINWQSDEVETRLNPRWPSADYDRLHQLANSVTSSLELTSHLWIATSGSTAENISGIKLVALSKQAFMNSAMAVNEHLGSTGAVGRSDVWAQVLPLFHVGGMGIEARASLSGAKRVAGLLNQKWDAAFFHEVLRQEKVTLSALVPTQVYDLVQAGLRAPDTLRAVVVGGGAFSQDLYRQARELGWPVLPSYGMTETCSQIATASLQTLATSNASEGFSFPSIGLLKHASVRQNGAGFLEVSASSLFTCYAQWQEGEARHWDPKHDTWFTTEDRGKYVDSALSIQGRGQDYIKIGGEAVLLSHLRSNLEAAVARHKPELASEFALIAQASARLEHEIQIVFSWPATLADATEIQKLYDKSVRPFERVRALCRVEQIPRSDLGKVMYGLLRQQLANQGARP